jgi:DNA-binding beta-propeller fold protein YncE
MSLRVLIYVVSFALFVQSKGDASQVGRETQERATTELRARIEASPVLPFKGMHFAAQPPSIGWQSGAVSGIAVDSKETIYEIQRGDKACPVVVLDRDGKVLRSWGKGEFKIPHSIRIDPTGNVWTVDAASSTVIEYSSLGKKLMTITVGEQPDNGSPFDGTTDVAFAPNGHIFITDGYGNARVIEYTADGKRVKQWGKPGTAPGDFNLPHAIQINAEGIIYVADREKWAY